MLKNVKNTLLIFIVASDNLLPDESKRVVEEKFNLKNKIEQHKQLYETVIIEKLGVC